jgi:hypothetical protein
LRIRPLPARVGRVGRARAIWSCNQPWRLPSSVFDEHLISLKLPTSLNRSHLSVFEIHVLVAGIYPLLRATPSVNCLVHFSRFSPCMSDLLGGHPRYHSALNDGGLDILRPPIGSNLCLPLLPRPGAGRRPRHGSVDSERAATRSAGLSARAVSPRNGGAHSCSSNSSLVSVRLLYPRPRTSR